MGRTSEQSFSSQLCNSCALAIWLAVLAVGVFGGMMAYPKATIPSRPPAPVAVKDLKVELAGDSTPLPGLPSPTPEAADSEPSPAPIPLPPVTPTPLTSEVRDAPPLLDLATPSPAIAFAVPVAKPEYAETTPAPAAAPAAPTPAQQPAVAPGKGSGSGPPRPLTLGMGEGRQPRPMYPRAAERAGQQGRVVVRLTVGENGRVVSAEAAEPSPWPLLNDAAVKTIRDRWRFSAGEVRVYQVTIVFKLDN